ncbi:hypothetical protein ABWL39_15530 [Chitinivorax sp. PXF-14]|uniref:hypothetical protein n=1 Tax=Chitinivorax sp. PXF-14 TaxID=3230488 RepID=UPI003467296D
MRYLVIVAPLLAAISAGCSSVPMQSSTSAERYQAIDYEKIQLVEDYAKRRAIDVHWVNYPTRTYISSASAKNSAN